MLKRLIIFPTIFLLIWIVAGNAKVQPSETVELNVKTHTYTNGLQLLVVERHLSPTVSCIVRFKVGSIDERPGITGSAHLLEHMLFKGTKNIGTTNYDAEAPLMARIDSLAHQLTAAVVETRSPLYRGGNEKVDSLRALIAKVQETEKPYTVKDELWETYLKNGGANLNANTSNDGTQYLVSLPSNKLELWAYLESDRLENPIFREFYSERDVVYEERRLRTDNDPDGKLEEQLSSTAFTASPYRWPVVGWASDLETVLREQVEAFYYQYYSPNNAIIAIVGDVNFNDVVKLIGRYFEHIPPSKTPPPSITTTEPEQAGEKRVEVEFDAQPELVIAWHEPAGGAVDKEVFDIISYLLSRGRTSRLYKSLVEQKQLVTSIYASSDFGRMPSLFSISASPRSPHTVAEVEQAIYEEIDKLQNEGATDWELTRVRNQLEAEYIRGMQSNLGMAFRLSSTQALTNDWTYIMKLKELRSKVTSDDVKRVLEKYFTQKNRTIATIIKPKDSDAKPESSNIQKMKPAQGVVK